MSLAYSLSYSQLNKYYLEIKFNEFKNFTKIVGRAKEILGSWIYKFYSKLNIPILVWTIKFLSS